MKKTFLHSMIVALAAGATGLASAADIGPLDRVVALAESTIEPIVVDQEVTLMSADLRTVGNSGLLIQFAAECGLWAEAAPDPDDPTDPTDPTDPADPEDPDDPDDPIVPDEPADAPATGRVLVWVEVDGEPVNLGGDVFGSLEDGRIVFCGGDIETVAQADPNDPLELFDATRRAGSFNWTVDTRTNGPVRVEVKASLDTSFDHDDDPLTPDQPSLLAQAAIGARTLVIQPLRRL